MLKILSLNDVGCPSLDQFHYANRRNLGRTVDKQVAEIYMAFQCKDFNPVLSADLVDQRFEAVFQTID